MKRGSFDSTFVEISSIEQLPLKSKSIVSFSIFKTIISSPEVKASLASSEIGKVTPLTPDEIVVNEALSCFSSFTCLR